MAYHLPVLLDLREKLCVVVGGGDVALRKVKTLAEKCALVRVVSPDAHDEIKDMAGRGLIEWDQKLYESGDLKGSFLCVAATNDPGINAEVRHEASVRRVLANVVDDPEGSDYQVPSFFEDGPLIVAVSTSGMSPAVSRTLRRMIQEYLGDSAGSALELINSFRERAKKEIDDQKARVKFWEEGMNAEVLEKVREGDLGAVKNMLEDALQRFKSGNE